MLNIAHILAEELSLRPAQVKTRELLAEGATIPFIPLPEGAHWEMNEILQLVCDLPT